MQTKLLSFDLMESCLGSSAEMSGGLLQEENDTEYRRLLQAVPKILSGELTQRQQECVRLYYFEGMKLNQIAELLGVQPSTVSKHLKKARRRLERVMTYSFSRLR
ncbi:MAG: sigma-70 family RNA polymerase sigma factor [Oscillospiraceae bacterium]|nr:sigma-70 family RNA polymerase sigma factor [Oscillospiraceae bacterium]